MIYFAELWNWLRYFDELLLVVPATIIAKLTWRFYSFRDFSSDDIDHLYNLKRYEEELISARLELNAEQKHLNAQIAEWQETLTDSERRRELAEKKAAKRAKELAGARQRFKRKLGE